jgi:hypothetical protein
LLRGSFFFFFFSLSDADVDVMGYNNPPPFSFWKKAMKKMEEAVRLCAVNLHISFDVWQFEPAKLVKGEKRRKKKETIADRDNLCAQ